MSSIKDGLLVLEFSQFSKKFLGNLH